MKGFTLVTITLLLSACASQQQIESELASYIGSSIDSAVSELGRPSSRTDMQDGTWEYIWDQQSRNSTTASTSPLGIPIAKSFNKSCSRVLVTDQRKRVISYHTLGRC